MNEKALTDVKNESGVSALNEIILKNADVRVFLKEYGKKFGARFEDSEALRQLPAAVGEIKKKRLSSSREQVNAYATKEHILHAFTDLPPSPKARRQC